ncbi:MAG: hypothetical protein ACOCXA_07060, partial [Planctomycetota bacterium]
PSWLRRRIDTLIARPPLRAPPAPGPGPGPAGVGLPLAGGLAAVALAGLLWWGLGEPATDGVGDALAEDGPAAGAAMQRHGAPGETAGSPPVPEPEPAAAATTPVLLASGFGEPWAYAGAWQPSALADDSRLRFPGDPAVDPDLRVGMRLQGRDEPIAVPAWNCQMRYGEPIAVPGAGIAIRVGLAPQSHLVQGWEVVLQVHGQDQAGAVISQRLRVAKNSGQSAIRLLWYDGADWQPVGGSIDRSSAVDLQIAARPDGITVLVDDGELGSWQPGFTIGSVECGIQLWKLTFCRLTTLELRDFSIVRAPEPRPSLF